MATLILAILLGLAFSYFATQNTQGISLAPWQYSFANIPLYVVILGALLLGVAIAVLFSLLSSISTALTLRGKDNEIQKNRSSVQELQERVHELEVENARLKGEEVEEKETRTYQTPEVRREPSFLDRLRASFS